MTQKETNDEYIEMLNKRTFSKDMLLSVWSILDKDVSKYAYLKKKFINAKGNINDGNIYEFDRAIQKRNIIEKFLKFEYGLNRNEIKALISELPKERIIFKKHIDDVCKMLKEIYV